MTNRLSFHEEIRKNKISSYFLITVVLIVLLAIVYTIGFALGGDYFWFILIFGTVLSLAYIVGSFYKSAEIAIASVGAKLAKNLLGKFGSVKGVINASEEDLKNVELIGDKKAKKIKKIVDKDYIPR